MLAKQRRRKAIEAAVALGADALLVTHAPDVRWLSGFTGSNGVVALMGGRAVLFTDGRYTAQAKAEASNVRVIVGKVFVAGLAVQWLVARGATRCAFDARQTTVAALEGMRRALPKDLGAKRRSFFLATEGLTARLREIKDSSELETIQRAATLGCALFADISGIINSLGQIRPGATERDVALQLELHARRSGAEGMSFETIVASGARSALPHGKASAQKLPRRGFVTLDFGVIVDGYCSDMTRTVHLGKGSSRERAVYDAVLEAQMAAVAAVAPGVTCAEVDGAARSVLKRAKLARWFSHSTGHGVGLEIHEGPRLATKVEQVLEPGMVITVEPGVYLPGEFGVRIEDMVLVTEAGGEVLTAASPKNWTEL